MGMFYGTSLLAVWFCSASNAAQAAFTGLFCIRRVHQLRHTKLSVTGVYMKEIPAEVREAVESMDAELCLSERMNAALAATAPVN